MFIFYFCRTKHNTNTKSAISNQKSRHKIVRVHLLGNKYNQDYEEKQLESKKYNTFHISLCLFLSLLYTYVKESDLNALQNSCL